MYSGANVQIDDALKNDRSHESFIVQSLFFITWQSEISEVFQLWCESKGYARYKKINSSVLRGETLNYRSRAVAMGFLWMVFCHTLFCSVLCCYIGEMYDDEHLNF